MSVHLSLRRPLARLLPGASAILLGSALVLALASSPAHAVPWFEATLSLTQLRPGYNGGNAAPMATYSWSEVNNVDHYQVTINGGNPFNTSATTYTVTTSQGGQITFAVDAVMPGGGGTHRIDPNSTLISPGIYLYQYAASANQAVDSRLNPRDRTAYLDYQFGDGIYNGGLFAGYNGDGARVGRSYIKLSLADIPGTGSVVRADLNCWFLQKLGAGSPSIGAYLCTDTSWTESGLVWSTAPSAGSTATGTATPSTEGSWVGWNVTADVNSRRQGSISTMTEVLGSTSETTVGWYYFAKRQYATEMQPMLVVAK